MVTMVLPPPPLGHAKGSGYADDWLGREEEEHGRLSII